MTAQPVAQFENRLSTTLPEGDQHSHSHDHGEAGHGHGHDHATEEHGHTHEHLEHAGESQSVHDSMSYAYDDDCVAWVVDK